MDPYHFPDDGPTTFRRERDLGDVIRAAIQWMRETAGLWIPAVAAIAGPFYLLSAIFGAFVGPESAGGGLIGLLDGIAGLLLSGAIFGLVRRYRVGEVDLSVGEVWDEAKAWIGPLFGFGFVTVLLAIVLLIPFFVVIGLAGGENAGVAVWAVLGFLLIVIAVLAAPYYTLGIVSRVFDEDSAIDAYKRAARLIKPHRMLATGTVFVIYGIVFFIVAVLSGGIEGALLAFGASPLVTALGSVVSILVLVPASVFGSVASVFLFEALVEREEGTALDAEIEAIRDGAPDAPVRPVDVDAGPDRRGFAERLREGADDDARAPGGFRGGGFEDPA